MSLRQCGTSLALHRISASHQKWIFITNRRSFRCLASGNHSVSVKKLLVPSVRPEKTFKSVSNNVKILAAQDFHDVGKFYTSSEKQSSFRFIKKLAIFVSSFLTGILLLGKTNLLPDELHSKAPDDLQREPEESIKRETEQNQKTLGTPKEEEISLEEAVFHAKREIYRLKVKSGAPGVSVAVSVNGKTVLTDGIGYADVENQVPCRPTTVMRIASISKPITMAAVAKLWEQGDLDLDKPVQHYVPEFPEKTWKGEKVSITTRQLVSHLAGIRHYDKRYMLEQKKVVERYLKEGGKEQKTSTVDFSVRRPEIYNKMRYRSVIQSLDLFKDDPLVKKPGTELYYSSHGWTLISAVVERAAKVPFEDYLCTMLGKLGMNNTYLDLPEKLIPSRGRQYCRNAEGEYENAPYIDMSCKWGGEGLLSNVLDLVKFGNAMLHSYQATSCHDNKESSHQLSFLKPDTVQQMWTKMRNTDHRSRYRVIGYGMGWRVYDVSERLVVGHTGAALGGSSVLLISTPKTESHIHVGSIHKSSRMEKDLSISGSVRDTDSPDINKVMHSAGTDFDSRTEQNISNAESSMMDTDEQFSSESNSNLQTEPNMIEARSITSYSDLKVGKQNMKPRGVVVSILLNKGHGKFVDQDSVDLVRIAIIVAELFERTRETM